MYCVVGVLASPLHIPVWALTRSLPSRRPNILTNCIFCEDGGSSLREYNVMFYDARHDHLVCRWWTDVHLLLWLLFTKLYYLTHSDNNKLDKNSSNLQLTANVCGFPYSHFSKYFDRPHPDINWFTMKLKEYQSMIYVQFFSVNHPAAMTNKRSHVSKGLALIDWLLRDPSADASDAPQPFALLCNPKHCFQQRFSNPVLLTKRQRSLTEALLVSFGATVSPPKVL